ncbi:MAG: DUF362 domain-containing protein [Candidatus Hydrogenedentes bacterium]|nr:DUF362 domain-containing protein [Candidatus Hydrogenedentota bacterium]
MSDVIVLKSSESTIADTIRAMFELAGGIDKYVSQGERVLVKPNFIAPKGSASGVTTDLGVIEAVIAAVLDQDATPIIGEGVPIAYNADATFGRLGVRRLAEKYGVDLVNMDEYPYDMVAIDDAIVLKETPVCRLVREVDKIINLPKMKTHTQTTITLGMKNLKGCVPGEHKLKLHRLGVSAGVVDLNTIIKPTFTIIDGIVALEGNGPTNGQPKRMNLLLGSDDILALEIIGATIMGFRPHRIKHIYLSRNKGIGEYNVANINVIGENVADVTDKFSLPVLKFSKWLGPLALGLILPTVAWLGIDITRVSQRIFERFLPYPEFGDKCTGCGKCIKNCPAEAITFADERRPVVDHEKCIKCYVCDEVCMFGNVRIAGKGGSTPPCETQNERDVS